MKSIICHKCQNEWTFTPPMPRKGDCPACGADAHVCQNCSFFDRQAHHECREEQAEWVREKDRANFCGYFEPGIGERRYKERLDTKAKLDSLFKSDKAEAPSSKGSLEEELAKFLSQKK